MQSVQIKIPSLDRRSDEAYKTLRTNLQFCGKDVRSIAITSCTPSEGKSEISLHLAKSLSESGKRVLFIDADLRKSVIISRCQVSQTVKGLSHYLTGQATKDQVIYATEEEGFYLAVAGPLSPDPTSLLNSELFAKFMKEAREEFDYVIVDAPPLGLVIDAVIIGQCTDGTVVVIEQGVIKRKLVQDVIKQMKRGGIRILGAVLNKVDDRVTAYGDYGYGYYAEEDKKSKKH